MKKFIACTVITVFMLVIVMCIIIYKSVIREDLPHGAVMHILPASNINNVRNAIILCPGGGYASLAKWREGYMWLPYYHFLGYTVAVLEYRMPNHDYRIPMTDGGEALVSMRNHAKEWGFNKNQVGMMGFSAGGHLVSSLMVSDNPLMRPDYAVLFYPVVSMKHDLTHQGSHDKLLGKDAPAQLEEQNSPYLHVSDQTPPAYIVVCPDDKIVNPQNAICFYDQMRAKSRPVTLQTYPSGGHGWGYRLTYEYHNQMLKDLKAWLLKMQAANWNTKNDKE